MTDDFFLRNKNTHAIITGGTQGLGLAVAKRLAREGSNSIVITGRRPELAPDACAQVRDLMSASDAKCIYIQADVSKVEDCFRLVDSAIEQLAGVNSLVNSAAITDRGSLLDSTPEMWQVQFDTNVRGPFFLMQRLVADWLKNQTAGSIVNVLSQSAHCGQDFLVPYSSSKAALANLTKNVANSYMRQKVRCNGIMLGWMDTPGEAVVQKKFHHVKDDWLAQAEASRPMGQLVKPDQVASLIAYLVSPESGVMTGALVDYDQAVLGASN